MDDKENGKDGHEKMGTGESKTGIDKRVQDIIDRIKNSTRKGSTETNISDVTRAQDIYESDEDDKDVTRRLRKRSKRIRYEMEDDSDEDGNENSKDKGVDLIDKRSRKIIDTKIEEAESDEVEDWVPDILRSSAWLSETDSCNDDSLPTKSKTVHSYVCEVCGKSLATASRLTEHMLVHLVQGNHKCRKCTFPFKKKIHMERHMAKCVRVCIYCWKEFGSKQECNKHEVVCPVGLKVNGPKDPGNGGDNGGSDESAKVGHGAVRGVEAGARSKGKEITDASDDDVEWIPDSNSDSNDDDYHDHDESFPTSVQNYGKTKFAVINGEFVCTVCSKSFKNPRFLRTHMASHFNLGYECSKCKYIFKRKFNFKKHSRTCGKVCRYCSKEIESEKALKAHEDKCINTNVTTLKHKCTICGQGFHSLSSLEHHEKVHGKKDHVCKTCGKAFNQKKYLDKHLETHLTVKPFLCQRCGFSTKTQRLLEHHQLKHLKKGAYKCHYCGKRFKQQHWMKYHIATHTGVKEFKCSYCEKRFARPGGRSAHEKMHRNEKKHVCEICNKKFNLRAHLMQHLRTHGDERPHKCKICGDGFKFGHHLTQHMSTHNKKIKRKKD